MLFKNYKTSIIFYIVISIGLIGVLFSNPFLRYPYDMIYHLILIDEIYTLLAHPVKFITGIWIEDIYILIPLEEYKSYTFPEGREIWHYLWASLFNILNIENKEIFLRAKIIHIIQIYITLFSIYYFSNVTIRNTFIRIPNQHLSWLSFWSIIIWITIFSTKSAAYHQVWIMWYSVNYQITLALFWYITALSLVLFLEKTSWKKKLFFTLQIILISRFILQAHSMEFLYYLMYISVFFLIFMKESYSIFKKYFYVFIPIIISIGYFIIHYQPDNAIILNYLSLDKLPQLYQHIMREGNILLHGFNRSLSSINELMYFIFYFSFLFLIYIINQYKKYKTTYLNIKFVLFLLITSLFVIIPLFQFSGGLFALITKTMVVNRLYYSSSLFVLLPIFIYYIMTFYHIKLKYINLMIFISLVSIFIFSKYNNILTHNYYKNIISIKNSFIERKVGFNLSEQQIKTIGQLIQNYEEENKKKKIKYYARSDIAFVIKYIYQKNVYWEGRRSNPNYLNIFNKNKYNPDYIHILFKVPKDFPNYQPYL